MNFAGVLNASFGFKSDGWQVQLPSFSFSIICFVIFLGIQKKIHKDAFIEIKAKIAQQTEFQTIFDELDESVVILNLQSRII